MFTYTTTSNMKKIGIAFTFMSFIYFCALVFQSCSNPDPCSPSPDPVYRPLESIKPELKRITGIEKGDYSRKLIVDTIQADSNGIRYDSLGIDVRNNFISKNESTRYEVSTVYACSPRVDFDNVREVFITSSEDYTVRFPKGSNLTELLLVREGYTGEGQRVDSFMLNRPLHSSNYLFTFQFPPTEDKFHNITIKYILTDGREYLTSLENVYIKK